MQNLKGLSKVAPQYDGILFDIYGVIHNSVAWLGIASFSLKNTILERYGILRRRILLYNAGTPLHIL